MGKTGEGCQRAKPDVRGALALHLLLNPERGRPLLVGIDAASGQLFFTSARGLCTTRDKVRAASVAAKVYDAWPQLRPSA